jgi:hypothetical protein
MTINEKVNIVGDDGRKYQAVIDNTAANSNSIK